MNESNFASSRASTAPFHFRSPLLLLPLYTPANKLNVCTYIQYIYTYIYTYNILFSVFFFFFFL